MLLNNTEDLPTSHLSLQEITAHNSNSKHSIRSHFGMYHTISTSSQTSQSQHNMHGPSTETLIALTLYDPESRNSSRFVYRAMAAFRVASQRAKPSGRSFSMLCCRNEEKNAPCMYSHRGKIIGKQAMQLKPSCCRARQRPCVGWLQRWRGFLVENIAEMTE